MMAVAYLGAVVVASVGIYALRKSGVSGAASLLGVAAVPVVWFGWKAVLQAREAAKPEYTPRVIDNQAASGSGAVVPQKPLNGFEALDLAALNSYTY